jgi:hypothetical protein
MTNQNADHAAGRRQLNSPEAAMFNRKTGFQL